MGARQQADEVEIVQRRDDFGAGVGGEPRAERVAHVRVGMDGQDQRDIGPLQDALEGVADLADAVAKVLAPMTGRQNDPASPVARGDFSAQRGEARIGLDPGPRGLQRVDDGVAGDEDLRLRDILEMQHLRRARRRGEMLVRDLGDDLAVHLFRPGFVDVAAAQARLDMRDGDAAVKGGERADHGAGRVALHDDAIGPGAVVDIAKRQQKPRGQFVERLVRLHDVEIEILRDLRQREDRVEQVAMLGRHANRAAQILPRLKLVDEGEELQRLGAGADDDEDVWLHEGAGSIDPLRSLGRSALRKHGGDDLAIGEARFPDPEMALTLPDENYRLTRRRAGSRG